MKKQPLTPCRPYLLRAYYHWLLDNQLTPYLVAKSSYPGVKIPLEAAKDGKVVLNIAPQAVTEFAMDMDKLQFSACFNSIPQEIMVPIAAVVGIYARENGAGTLFSEEPAYLQVTKLPTAQEPAVDRKLEILPSDHRDRSEKPPTPPAGGRPQLHLIK